MNFPNKRHFVSEKDMKFRISEAQNTRLFFMDQEKRGTLDIKGGTTNLSICSA